MNYHNLQNILDKDNNYVQTIYIHASTITNEGIKWFVIDIIHWSMNKEYIKRMSYLSHDDKVTYFMKIH